MTPEPLLRLQGWSLERRMSGASRTVLAGIDLELVPGRWTAVLGANGSGKSSLLKFLASDGSPLRHPAAIMFQDPDEQIFATSVTRELTLGRRGLDPDPILERFGLPGTAARDPRLLSAGQKQRLALAVAVSAEPRVLFCDEPTALQDPAQAGWILDELDRWRTGGGALLTATCDRREAGRADWLVILEDGRIREQGPAAEILAGERARALLGDETTAETVSFVGGEGKALSLEGVGFRFPGVAGGLDDVTVALDPGARLGVTGPNGCGKSTLLAAMAGARRPDRGVVRLGERTLYRKDERDLDHGRALLAPQFPEYLFTRSSVAEEILLDPALARLGTGEFLARVGLGDDLQDRNPHDLSCGQKRRLALGLVILAGRPVVLLDEPTAALDRAGRARVLELLTALPPETVLVIASHDRDFLARAGCAVLDLGDATGTGP